MGHEGFISPIKKEPGILDSLEKQLLLAKKLENSYENRPDPKSFVGSMKGTKFESQYTEEAIKKDELYEKETRAKIDEKNSSFGRDELDRLEGGFQLSEMLQAMVVDCINKYWFKNYISIMTTDFDDLAVGIDAVMKRKNKDGYLGLSIDFTVTNQDKNIYKKLERAWDKNIKEGKIPVVKYFEDPDTKEKGRLIVPKFIIGASKQDVEVFAKAYLSDDIKTLENHPFKYLMLMQIEEQLQTALDYYEDNKDNPSLQFAKTQYEKIQAILRSMKNEIHSDEKIHENTDLHEYSKSSIALDMMRRFRIMRSQPSK